MREEIFIFPGLSDSVLDRINEVIKKAKREKDSDSFLLVFGENLSELGQRVTPDKIEDFSFAQFIQLLLKRELAKPDEATTAAEGEANNG